MLKIFETYKYYLIGVAFVIYSIFIWNVSSRYTENSYLKDKLNTMEITLDTNQKNQVTKDQIARIVAEALVKWRSQNAESNRKIENEISKDPVYRDCKSNPNIMREYQNKLDNQPE